VNAGGVTNVSVNGNVLSGFGLDFIYKNNFVYATNGVVVDISSSPFVSGAFTNVNGPVVYDNYYNRVCFASYDWSGNIIFKRFNPNTFLLFDSLPISQAFGDVKSLITCGNGCYALNTSDNKVIIIKDSTLGVSEIELKKDINVYPNPTTDYLYINSEIEIKNVIISDLNGRIINDLQFYDNKMFLGNLENGLYIANIIDVNGNSQSVKIIKK
jgi:hypothetical protein